MSGNLRTTLEMIKWEHSIFALPFALARRHAGGRGGYPRHGEYFFLDRSLP